MKPLLNTKQLKGLISDHVKKIEIIFKIGPKIIRVWKIFVSEKILCLKKEFGAQKFFGL